MSRGAHLVMNEVRETALLIQGWASSQAPSPAQARTAASAPRGPSSCAGDVSALSATTWHDLHRPDPFLARPAPPATTEVASISPQCGGNGGRHGLTSVQTGTTSSKRAGRMEGGQAAERGPLLQEGTVGSQVDSPAWASPLEGRNAVDLLLAILLSGSGVVGHVMVSCLRPVFAMRCCRRPCRDCPRLILLMPAIGPFSASLCTQTPPETSLDVAALSSSCRKRRRNVGRLLLTP